MKSLSRFLPACLLFLSWCATVNAQDAARLICCGGEEVFVIATDTPQTSVWSWTAAQSEQIPELARGWFRTTDECKPYKDDLLLVTSSSGGVALLERSSKACLFLTRATNAHSACLLPDDQVVIAASYGGDQLQFFSRTEPVLQAQPDSVIPLVGAHGAVWDSRRHCLWALGDEYILQVTWIAAEEAKDESGWRVVARHELPSHGGHDLSRSSDDDLFVTTNSQVLLFDLRRHELAAHPELGDRPRVKSIDRDSETGQVVYHQATEEHWWSDTIQFTGTAPIQLPGKRLYKIRWDRPEPVPQIANPRD